MGELDQGLPNFVSDIKTAFVELSIAWSEIDQECFIESYRVAANDLHVATIVRDAGDRDIRIAELNTKNPLFDQDSRLTNTADPRTIPSLTIGLDSPTAQMT